MVALAQCGQSREQPLPVAPATSTPVSFRSWLLLVTRCGARVRAAPAKRGFGIMYPKPPSLCIPSLLLALTVFNLVRRLNASAALKRKWGITNGLIIPGTNNRVLLDDDDDSDTEFRFEFFPRGLFNSVGLVMTCLHEIEKREEGNLF